MTDVWDKFKKSDDSQVSTLDYLTEFLLTSQDKHGHSVVLSGRVLPGMAKDIADLIATQKTPIKNMSNYVDVCCALGFRIITDYIDDPVMQRAAAKHRARVESAARLSDLKANKDFITEQQELVTNAEQSPDILSKIKQSCLEMVPFMVGKQLGDLKKVIDDCDRFSRA